MPQVLRTFDSMLSEGVTNEMVKAGIDLQTHMGVSINPLFLNNDQQLISPSILVTLTNRQVMRIQQIINNGYNYVGLQCVQKASNSHILNTLHAYKTE